MSKLLTSTSIKIVLGLTFSFLMNSAFAQSRSAMKKQCVNVLGTYKENGQMNLAQLTAGDSAEVNYVFYPGIEYRITMDVQTALGNVHFKLVDANGVVVFNSEKSSLPYFDLKFDNTKQLRLQVIAPKDENDVFVSTGLVMIMVGSKS